MSAEKNEPTRKEEETRDREEQGHKEGSGHLVVAIGASAGGLEALKQFFQPLCSADNMAFAVIQHLSPDHQSHMGEILGKTAFLPVETMEDGMKINPGCIYCNPPSKEVSLLHGVFHLSGLAPRGMRAPIDHFFRSLAEDQGRNAVAVILSGTGTDGTLGVKEIKARGGNMVMVQDPAQAHYDGMPKSAIETGIVDHVLPVEKMPKVLIEYARTPYLAGVSEPRSSDRTFEEHVQNILIIIRSRTGNDFSHYKQSSTHRRIQRRMAIHRIQEISHYVRYMQENQSRRTGFLRICSSASGCRAFSATPYRLTVLQQRSSRTSLPRRRPSPSFASGFPAAPPGRRPTLSQYS